MANRTTRHFAAKLGPGMVVALALLLAGCASGDEEGEALAGGELVPATAATEGLYASFFDAAVAAERGRDYVSAITFYNSLYQRDPYELKAVLGLARNFRFVGAPERAVTVLEIALSKSPKEPALVSELGKVHLAAGEPEKALGWLLKARELSPNDWRIHSALGITYDRLARYQAARLSYQAALDRSPSNVSVLNNLALSYVQTANLDRGIEILARAITMPQASIQARQNLALLYALNGDIDKAEKLARADLPEKMVRKNLEYYRMLASSRRQADTARSLAPLAVSESVPGTAPVQIGPWDEDTETEREGATALGSN